MSANDWQMGGAHYRKNPNFQHWDWAWQQEYDQFQYCITKYVDRHKNKNGIEDLYKAKHHLDKYIELLEDGMLEKAEYTEMHEASAGYVDQD